MRLSHCAASVLTLALTSVAGACTFPPDQNVVELPPLDGAIARPLVHVTSATLIAHCPFPEQLKDLNHDGHDGELHYFRLRGTFFPEPSDATTDPIVGFPSATYATDELSVLDGLEWSVRLLGPSAFSGDDCAPPSLVVDAGLGAHTTFVMPFPKEQFCVLRYDELIEHKSATVCVGARVGPIGEWHHRLDLLGN